MLLQSQRPMLRPQTTAHLAQTMALLELTTAELHQKVEAELARNPALELIEEIRVTLVHEVGHFLGLDEDELWDKIFDLAVEHGRCPDVLNVVKRLGKLARRYVAWC